MTVRATYQLTNPDQAEAELTIRMTVGEWKQLAAQLDTNYPAWKLSATIRRVVSLASERFDEQHKED